MLFLGAKPQQHGAGAATSPFHECCVVSRIMDDKEVFVGTLQASTASDQSSSDGDKSLRRHSRSSSCRSTTPYRSSPPTPRWVEPWADRLQYTRPSEEQDGCCHSSWATDTEAALERDGEARRERRPQRDSSRHTKSPSFDADAPREELRCLGRIERRQRLISEVSDVLQALSCRFWHASCCRFIFACFVLKNMVCFMLHNFS